MIKRLSLCAAGAILATGTPALAVVSFDQNVTPDVIFGSGNANGGFTVDRSGGIEIGLRGKLRFNASNLPENTFNSNGDGTYSFAGGAAPGGFSFAQPPTTTPIWNFEWSVNTDFDGSTGSVLSDLTYEIGLDFDPSAGTNFLTFDPITPTTFGFDHSLGDNSTTAANDVSDSNLVNYTANLNQFNVAQNSWNYEFFNNAPFDTFDPNVAGTYDIFLRAFASAGNEVSRTDIAILVDGGAIPEPVSAGLGLLAMGALGVGATRRNRR